MDTHNISVCVAPSIFHKSDRQTLIDVESSFQTIAFVKSLIENCQQIFGEDTITLLNPPIIQIIQDQKVKEDILIDNDENELDKASPVTGVISVDSTKISLSSEVQTSTIKQNPTIQKREFGRMLNLVSLKGRKSLAPKIAAKAKAVSSSSSSSLSTDLTAPTAKMMSCSVSSASSYSSTTSIHHQFNDINKLNDPNNTDASCPNEATNDVSSVPKLNFISFSKNNKNLTNNSSTTDSSMIILLKVNFNKNSLKIFVEFLKILLTSCLSV